MEKLFNDWHDFLKAHNNSVGVFLKNMDEIAIEYKHSSNSKSSVGFNAFTIASDLYYRENFHSDIIKSILDPNGTHKEGSKYLDNFIKLINLYEGKEKIRVEDFLFCNVVRERKYVDVLIVDDFSKKAIIVENKINNAIDQENQLPKYLKAISENYTVVGIVYLTLNFAKNPDKHNWEVEDMKKVEELLRIIPVFDHRRDVVNLYKDWIVPSIMQSDNIDAAFMLRQYGNLLKFLNTNTMDLVTMKKFYLTLKEGDNLETALSVRNLLKDLPEYLAIRIEDRYKSNCFPFKNVWRYQNIDAVFEACLIEDYYLKIDVWCDDEGYSVHFWDKNGKDVIQKFKNEIDALSGFEAHGEGHSNIKKRFNDLFDDSIYEFLDSIISRLKELKEIGA